MVRRGPLSGVNNITWADLHDAYGPAAQIPGHLQLLNSSSPDDRDDGRYFLYMGIRHQTVSITEATAEVVPFLVALAGAPRVRDRGRILDLLGHICQAPGPDHANDPKAVNADEDRWEQATRAAVRAGTETYLALLDAPDMPAQLRLDDDDSAMIDADRSPVRQMRAALGPSRPGSRPADEGAATRVGALFVLSRITPPPAGLQARLEQRLLREKHPAARLALILTLGRLARAQPAATGLLRALALRPDADASAALEAAAATLGLIHAAPRAVEEQHLTALAEPLRRWRELTDGLFRVDACDDPMAWAEDLAPGSVASTLRTLDRHAPTRNALLKLIEAAPA